MATKSMDVTELRVKALDVAVGQLEKQYASGTLVRVGDDEPRLLGVGEFSAAERIAPKRVFLAREIKP